MKGVPGDGEGRLYGPLVWVGSATLAASGVCLAILMISSVVGPFWFGVDEPAPPPPVVGLWLPPQPGPEAQRRVEAWRRTLPAEVAVVESVSLAELAEAGAGAVVLPDARALGPHDQAALTAWLARGGGAVLTGAVAVRAPDGAWLGWDRMLSLLAVRAVVPLEASASTRLAPARRGPISAALPPGSSLPLLPESGAPALADGSAELRWESAPPHGAAGASRRRRLDRGRLAWIAVGPESARLPDGDQWSALAEVFRGALAWVSRQPSLELLAWPDGSPLAVDIVESDAAAGSRERFEQRVRAEVAAAAETGDVARLVLAVGGLGAVERVRRASWARQLAESRAGWLAPESERRAWARRRDALRVGIVRVSSRRLRLEVSNRGAERVDGAAVRLHWNRPFADVEVRGTTLFQGGVRVRPAEAGSTHDGTGDAAADRAAPGEWSDLLLPGIPARSHRAWVVDASFPQAPRDGSRRSAAGTGDPASAAANSGR